MQEPVRKIITFGDRIKENYASLLDEKGLDYLNRLQKSTLQMQAFISDLQEFSMATIRAKPDKQRS
jgi:light-regulated signal transduction histidine kinase (bacteriophytochrome)